MLGEPQYKILKRLGVRAVDLYELGSNISSTISKENRQAFIRDLINDELIHYDSRHNTYKVSGKGAREIWLYEDKLKEVIEIEKSTHKKLLTDLKNAEDISKTHWWSFRLSIAAIAISLFLAILQLIEWLKS